MKLRCPYCRKTFSPPPPPHCPHCHRGMRVPENLQPRPFRERRKARERVAQAAERERERLVVPDSGALRRPAIVFGILFFMIVVGGLGVARLRLPTADPGRRVTQARAAVRILRIALERFRLDCRRYPTAKEGLRALVVNPGTPLWRGPYVNVVRSDPWFTAYRYEVDGTNVTVSSCGPDTRPGTADDVVAAAPTAEDVGDWRDRQ